MRIKVHRSAKIDLLEGKLFYDEKQLGLGDYFESSLESDIESLKLYAGIHPKHRGFYKALSDRFPSRFKTPSRHPLWVKNFNNIFRGAFASAGRRDGGGTVSANKINGSAAARGLAALPK